MDSRIQAFFVGTGGIVGSEITANVIETISFPVHDWASAITQLAIAVATIFGLFRKKRR